MAQVAPTFKISLLLLLPLASGCYRWQPVPRELRPALIAENPGRVRVTRGPGPWLTVESPELNGAILVGSTMIQNCAQGRNELRERCAGTRTVISIPLSEIDSLEARSISPTRTVIAAVVGANFIASLVVGVLYSEAQR